MQNYSVTKRQAITVPDSEIHLLRDKEGNINDNDQRQAERNFGVKAAVDKTQK